jgi:hypothetical protein
VRKEKVGGGSSRSCGKEQELRAVLVFSFFEHMWRAHKATVEAFIAASGVKSR